MNKKVELSHIHLGAFRLQQTPIKHVVFYTKTSSGGNRCKIEASKATPIRSKGSFLAKAPKCHISQPRSWPDSRQMEGIACLYIYTYVYTYIYTYIHTVGFTPVVKKESPRKMFRPPDQRYQLPSADYRPPVQIAAITFSVLAPQMPP